MKIDDVELLVIRKCPDKETELFETMFFAIRYFKWNRYEYLYESFGCKSEKFQNRDYF